MWESPERVTHHPDVVYHFEVLVAVVVRGILSHRVAQRYAHFGGAGYEHWVVANVVAVVIRNDTRTRLPTGTEKRLRAAVADLRRQATVN